MKNNEINSVAVTAHEVNKQPVFVREPENIAKPQLFVKNGLKILVVNIKMYDKKKPLDHLIAPDVLSIAPELFKS